MLGGCIRTIPHFNHENNICMARNDAQVWSRGEAGTKQVSLRAVFVPASLRRRGADGFIYWHTGSVPHGARPITLRVKVRSGAPRGSRPPFRNAFQSLSNRDSVAVRIPPSLHLRQRRNAHPKRPSQSQIWSGTSSDAGLVRVAEWAAGLCDELYRTHIG